MGRGKKRATLSASVQARRSQHPLPSVPIGRISFRKMKVGDPIPDSVYGINSYGVNRITLDFNGFTAHINGEMVGVVTFTVNPKGYAYYFEFLRDKPHTFVHWLYVYPKWQRRGIGGKILDHVRKQFGFPIYGEVESAWVKKNWARWSDIPLPERLNLRDA